MILALALLPIAASQTELPVRIVPQGSDFVLRNGAKTDRVPIRASEPDNPETPWPPDRVLFRRDAAYAVWDSRGLSVRQNNWVFTTQLPEIPLTPKLFSKEEIEKTKALIDGGLRTKEASGLSGALRDGQKVYFLTRWDEKGGKTWLEALVEVDLAEEKPKPKLVGRFAGHSLNLRPGKSRLFIRGGKLAAWVRADEQAIPTWGLALYDASSKEFQYEPVGERLEAVELVDERIGWFVGKTEYGARILHRWDSQSLTRRELLETRGTVRLMDPKTPWVAVVHEDEGSFLQNLDSGARLRLPTSPAFRWSAFGVLVWTPAQRPRSAALFEPERWERLGEWRR